MKKSTLGGAIKKQIGRVASIKGEVIATDSTKSPYFSPRKTRSHIKIQYENNSLQESPGKELIQNQKGEMKRKSVEKTKHVRNDKEVKWEPENWEKILENLKIMRKSGTAPVDTMGCHKCSDEDADEKTKRFHILVALMLSSQTKDQTTYDAMSRLKIGGLTPSKIKEMQTSTLEEMLKPVSFYKNKAKYLQKAAQILINQYNSDIPNNIEELVKLPGVGPKMAHICMSSAWGEVTGIGVDVHVHRIVNRLRWVPKPTKEPENTRIALESWLPYENWSEVNHLLVGFGQTICTPINPKCSECLNKDICPSANLQIKSKAKRKNT